MDTNWTKRLLRVKNNALDVRQRAQKIRAKAPPSVPGTSRTEIVKRTSKLANVRMARPTKEAVQL